MNDANGTNGQSTSTLRLVRDIATDSAELVRAEIKLARQEITEAMTSKLKLAVGLAVAGIFLLIGLVFAAQAAAAALATVVPPWAALLIVAASFLAIAGVATAAGLSAGRRASLTPEETVRTIKEDVGWAKAQLKR